MSGPTSYALRAQRIANARGWTVDAVPDTKAPLGYVFWFHDSAGRDVAQSWEVRHLEALERETLAEWNDGELTYLAALVRTGGDSPRVPADAVDSYLAVQHAGARRDRQPDVCECITLLMMVRAYVTSPTMPTDDEVVAGLWRAFWDRVGVQS